MLKNFLVTFERSNSTTGSDTFTALTKSEAIHDFHEVYRHDIYKILSVVEQEIKPQ